jgi:predicted DNA-binding transcriptional regulator AlpA
MKLLSMKNVTEKMGVCRRAIYRISERNNTFPSMRKPFGKTCCFQEDEINQWLERAMSENAKSS